jgi:hypothetical protein
MIDRDALTRARLLPMAKPRCERCFCQWTCAGGCHVNQTYPGATNHYTDFCIQTRLVTACLLLRDVGRDDLVDELLADRAAMEQLASHGWDPIDVGVDVGVTAIDAGDPPSPYWRTSDSPRSLVADGLTLLA